MTPIHVLVLASYFGTFCEAAALLMYNIITFIHYNLHNKGFVFTIPRKFNGKIYQHFPIKKISCKKCKYNLLMHVPILII